MVEKFCGEKDAILCFVCSIICRSATENNKINLIKEIIDSIEYETRKTITVNLELEIDIIPTEKQICVNIKQ